MCELCSVPITSRRHESQIKYAATEKTYMIKSLTLCHLRKLPVFNIVCFIWVVILNTAHVETQALCQITLFSYGYLWPCNCC